MNIQPAQPAKPIKYDENLPDFFKQEYDLTPDEIARAKELDKMTPLDRAACGKDEWNLWVKANMGRWLDVKTVSDHVLVSLKDWQSAEKIDFSEGQVVDDNGSFKVTQKRFSGFVFPSQISFRNAHFSDGVDFVDACFFGRAGFEATHFKCVAWFQNVHFGDSAEFTNAYFDSNTGFAGTIFLGSARFTNACFTGDVGFQNTCFDYTSFTSANFNGYANFARACFSGYAGFDGAIFEKYVRFTDARFMGSVKFDWTSVKGNFLCQRVIFLDEASWVNSEFNHSVNFRWSQFLSGADFFNAKMSGQVDFDWVWFGKVKSTRLQNAYTIKWEAELQRQYSKQSLTHMSMSVPSFKGTQFTIPPNLGYTEVPAPPTPRHPMPLIWRLFGRGLVWQKIKDADAAAKYRRLGELAAAGHHHLAEKRFFREELLARRGHEARTWPEVMMINLFEWFSKCGLSFWRPFGWWLAIFAGFYVWYGALATPDMFLSGIDTKLHLLNYTFSNATPLLGVLKGADSAAVDALFGSLSPGLRLLAGVHNFISSVFLFFALLAVRNYFKLS